jgi:mRNA interferase MazF
MDIQRGDVYFADLNPVVGAEQAGTRPVLIIQNNQANRLIPTVTVIPLTSNSRAVRFLFTVMIPAAESGLLQDSVALAFQVRTLDKSRLMRRAGRISPEKMSAIDRALRLHLAL